MMPRGNPVASRRIRLKTGKQGRFVCEGLPSAITKTKRNPNSEQTEEESTAESRPDQIKLQRKTQQPTIA